MNKVLSFAFCLFVGLLFAFGAKAQQQVYTITEALKNPDEVINLQLNSNTSNNQDFIGHAGSFSNLEKLEIVGELFEDQVEGLFAVIAAQSGLKTLDLNDNFLSEFPVSSLQNIEKLIIRYNSDLDFDKVLVELKKAPNIKTIWFDNNELEGLSIKSSSTANLNGLFLSGNQNIDLNDLLDDLTKCELNTLGLPLDELSKMPSNLNTVASLKNVYLEYDEYCKIRDDFLPKATDIVKGKGALMVNPGKDDAVNIHYVMYADDLSKTEKALIRDLYPGKAIKKQIRDRELELNQPYEEDVKELKTAVNTSDNSDVIEEKVKMQEANGGTKDVVAKTVTSKPKTNYNGVIVKSAAYSMYNDFYGDLKEKSGAVLNFNSRWSDTSYAFTSIEVTNGKFDKDQRLYLATVDGPKDEIWFNFDKNGYYYKNFTELNAFAGMQMVFLGAADKKAFNINYIKSKSYSDCRLKYRADEKEFTLVLKDEEGFTEIPVYMRMMAQQISLERAQTSYDSRYGRYNISMKRKADLFNKKLDRESQSASKNTAREESTKWKSFQALMSPEERLLPREEWMKYYQDIMVDEVMAIDNATASFDLMAQRLKLSGFGTKEELPKGMENLSAGFINEKQRPLPLKRILIINKNSGFQKVYELIGGVSGLEIDYEEEGGTILLAETRLGAMAYFSEYNFSKIKDDSPKEYKFVLKEIEKGSLTVSEMMKELELE